MTPVVKNILILNLLMSAITFAGHYLLGFELVPLLGMHLPIAEDFMPVQLISHMFMHSDETIFHLLFNMLMLWMIGRHLEMALGPKRFLGLYFAAGLGACALHVGISWWDYAQMEQSIVREFMSLYPDESMAHAKQIAWEQLADFRNQPMVGASGAIYGLLATFGLLFPEVEFMLLFPPIPIRAKFLVPGLIVIELLLGISSGGQSNVAHFAHLGGALVGLAAVWIWRGRRYS